MSTNDVPGFVAANRDILAMGCWAEHTDGSLIFVDQVEAGSVVYSMFDLSVKVEYRDAMPQKGFEKQFSYDPKNPTKDKWTWHDKTPFPWDRVMGSFPAGARHPSAAATMSAAARIAESLNLRAGAIRDRPNDLTPTQQRRAIAIGQAILDAVEKELPE